MQRQAGSAILRGMHLRCLIVDDNAQFLAAATDLLRREGVNVVGAASTIAEALQKATELRPDLYLVDIDLRDESGFDLARQLAAAPALQPSQVVLTSTYAELDFAELIADSPAAGFVPKSNLSAQALLEAFNRRPEPAPPE
jgi:two-component system nitrate/nitrite response regulator NarL